MQRKSFPGIQALRGLAACMVVIIHASLAWSHSRLVDPHVEWITGAAGVDIFFIISGFVMAISSIDKAGLTAGEFMKRRIIRVVPLYWIMTIPMMAKMILVKAAPQFGRPFPHADLTPAYIVCSFLLVPFTNSAGANVPILPPGWTLSFEMFFYLLFAVALLLRVNVVKFLTPVLISFAVVGMFRTDAWPSATVIFSPMLLEFLAGLILGYWVKKGFSIDRRLSAGLGAAGFILLLARNPFVPPSPNLRVVEWGLPALLIVQAFVAFPVPKWTKKIGDASYSLYLSHLLVVAILSKALPGLVETPFILACLAVSIPVSLALYRFVESPMTAAVKQWNSAPIAAYGRSTV